MIGNVLCELSCLWFRVFDRFLPLYVHYEEFWEEKEAWHVRVIEGIGIALQKMGHKLQGL